MIGELTSCGWKIAKKKETENDKQMEYEAVFKLVDINNSGSITKTVYNTLYFILFKNSNELGIETCIQVFRTSLWYQKCKFETFFFCLILLYISRLVPGSQ